MNKRKSQIFKILPPKEKFISFIKMYTNKTHTNYEFTYEKYKQAKYKNDIQKFIKEIYKYYYNSKKFYLTRKLTYKSFSNILRQFCKVYCFPFYSKITYNKSQYIMKYYIILPETD